MNRTDMAALRLHTKMTGEVVDIQCKTVAAMPKVIFNEVSKSTTEIDTENKTVNFILKPKIFRSINDFNKVKMIENAVWVLFGETWRCSLFVKDKKIYEGEPRKADFYGSEEFGRGREGFDPERA